MKKTAQTRQLLLESTLKLISEKGYLGATTKEIAHDAGVTELTLFRHFGSKERLFQECLNNYTFLPRLKELLPELEGLPFEDALCLIAQRFLLTLKERKAMIKIMYSELTIYPEKIRLVYNRFLDDLRSMLAGYFESVRKQGYLNRTSPEMAARVFLWIFFSYFRSEEIMRPGGMKKDVMDAHIREIIGIFMHGAVRERSSPGADREIGS